MKVSMIRVNHMSAPVFIDRAPEFSWRIENDEPNTMQTAYRITVCCGDETVWDSGRVCSFEQSFIPYRGEPLRACTPYSVHITAWDNHDNEATQSAAFETALLTPDDWTAAWIESTVPRNEPKLFTYGIENPVVRFSRSFLLEDEVKSARLYTTAYGCYRAEVNGVCPDDRAFAPEFTPYDKILNYQTYDVTQLLKQGQNELAFLVGDGWFFCPQTEVKTDEAHPAPAILFQLTVTFANGESKTFCSDGRASVRATDIVFSDLFMGEKRDLTLPEHALLPVKVCRYKKTHLRAQPMPPVCPVELFPAKRIYLSPKGETIVDFGQVIAGRARIFIDAPKGTEITFEYTEVTDRDGNYFATTSLRQCDTVISDGTPFLHEALFTYHGFRYIRVTGMPDAKKEDFTAVLLSTEKENAGAFICDDDRFNRLYQNIRYSQKNNMLSIPTDCPTREKAGWTGDILLYAKTAALNENVTPFLTSWLEGLTADQFENGVVPLVSPLTKLYDTVAMQQMAPRGAQSQTGIAGWGDAILWVPWQLYQITGNRQVLRNHYPAMKKWCGYIIRTANGERGSDLPEELDRWLWNTGFHFGEWLVPGKPSEGFEICRETACYVAPFFGYYSMLLLTEISDLLGEDSEPYRNAARQMKNAIRNGLFKNDRLPKDYMGAYVLAFAFDLVPDKYYDTYKNRLISLVEENGARLGTGFLATPFLLPVLDDLVRHDLALKILKSEEKPSWLYEVKMGATSIWENWLAMEEDGTPMKTSFDHYAFGVVDSYIFHSVCGIQSDTPGFSHITIRPDPVCFTSFQRIFVSEAGTIIVEKKGDILSVTIPCNTTATVIWNGTQTEIGSGKYTF